MALALHSFSVDENGQVSMSHTFYGATQAIAEKRQKAHAADCPHYGPALRGGHTIDIPEEIEELPAATEEELLEFLELGEEDEEEEE